MSPSKKRTSTSSKHMVAIELIDDEIELSAARFEALGNTKRLGIFRALVKAGPEGLAVGKIQELLGIPGSTLTHHLSKLIQTGLITQTRKSRILQCQANYKHMTDLISFLVEKCCGAEESC